MIRKSCDDYHGDDDFHTLVFDIGGTTARATLLAPGSAVPGSIMRASSESIRLAANWQDALARVLDGLVQDLRAERVKKVVLAVPGPVIGGQVSALPTLLGSNAQCPDLVMLAHRIWPMADIWICNDLVAAGYGLTLIEDLDFCVMTCGSGIGAKLFLAGRPLLGRAGMGGEIGHWQVPGAPELRCECGGKGHLGAIASGRGTLNLIKYRALVDPSSFARSGLAYMHPDRLTTRAIAAQFHANDPWTVDGLHCSAAAIAAAFACIHLATGIERFHITGGFAAALGESYIAMIAKAAHQAGWDTGVDWYHAIKLPDPRTEWALLGGNIYSHVSKPDFVMDEA